MSTVRERPGYREEPPDSKALAKELGLLCRRHGLMGAVLVSFTGSPSYRVGVNSSGEPAVFARAMEELAERILTDIDDGKFDPTVIHG